VYIVACLVVGQVYPSASGFSFGLFINEGKILMSYKDRG